MRLKGESERVREREVANSRTAYSLSKLELEQLKYKSLSIALTVAVAAEACSMECCTTSLECIKTREGCWFARLHCLAFAIAAAVESLRTEELEKQEQRKKQTASCPQPRQRKEGREEPRGFLRLLPRTS